MIIEINAAHPEPRKIARAVEALRAGEVIAFPTDTTYVLGCDLHDRAAIERLYQLKRLDRRQQLSFVCPDLGDIARYAMVDNQAYRLLKRLLPGPYTFILQATREVPKALMSKRRTVGIRVPAHPAPIALVTALGRPMLVSTAGPHGEDAYLDAGDVDAHFPGLAVVLDGGLGGTTPTTIVDLVEGVVVREGAGPVDDLF